jgi:AcrR family transcriptional regulator
VPKIVDHDARRQQIARTAMELIADEGTQGVSLRSIAARLGGSKALVTHYYSSRGALLLDLVTQLSASWNLELDAVLDGVESPHDAVSRLLTWLLPLDEEAQQEERARFQILATRDEPACLEVLLVFDQQIRALLADYLAQLVPPHDVETSVDMLRATTDGISLGYYTSPASWSAERQLATLDGALRRVVKTAPAARST